ncbi:hypothetical protein HY025_04255 [Candidatus Daviesbacteria bacterium]|nr:hypothetical protein [Candidatus Daviesbacteria bacterium]
MPQLKPYFSLTSVRISKSLRGDNWLLARLDYLWSNYFNNVRQVNPVFIKFGRFSRYRLGSIRFDKLAKHSYITITGMFKDPLIPIQVVDHTIAHELCHYTHGFSSPKPRLHKYPHHGGVIKKELSARGLGHLNKAYQVWLKEYRKSLH